MNVDIRMYECAKIASNLSGIPVELLYSQWAHESTDIREDSPTRGIPFKSELAQDNNNFGGVTQEEPNGEENHQPDGRFYYMKFDSPEAYAIYFARYLSYYRENGVFEAKTIPEYATALKNGGYFGDTLENYIDGMTDAYNNAFA